MANTQIFKTIAVTQQEEDPGILKLLACKCPRCRTGNMFKDKNPWHLKHTMKMYETCPVCGQAFNVEVGFYYGSSYVSYAFTVGFSVVTLIAWWLLIGFSYSDNKFLYWVIFNAICLIVLQPYFMRVARTGWLAFFVRYNPNWRAEPPKAPERTNKDHENNW